MTNQNLFLLGQLGKPHALNGYLYLNHEIFFREFNLTGLNVSIKDSRYEIENFKTHLKNRYLVKFKNLDSISSIEIFRGEKVYITSQQISNFISSNLPWPGFFVGTNLNEQYYIKNFFYAGELIYLTLVSKKEFIIPYNESFFKYQNDILHIINLDLFQ